MQTFIPIDKVKFRMQAAQYARLSNSGHLERNHQFSWQIETVLSTGLRKVIRIFETMKTSTQYFCVIQYFRGLSREFTGKRVGTILHVYSLVPQNAMNFVDPAGDYTFGQSSDTERKFL